MRSIVLALGVCALLQVAGGPALAGGVEAADVFEQLKGMAGTWRGTSHGEGAAAEKEGEAAHDVVHEFQISAAGTVVMETMNPGSDHEMINMYHLDGEELVITHYCAGGNQPTMRLDREASSGDVLVFDFTGGTNLDPAVDSHIHSAELRVVDANQVESIWKGYSGGVEAGVMTFHLTRGE